MAENYAETAALVDQMSGDFRERDERLAEFLPGELEVFIDQLGMLRAAAKDALREKYRNAAV
jgi:hypothetical protein